MNFWQELPKPFFVLAPMEAVTDVVFRHVIAHAARPDVFFTEFTNAASYCSPAGKHSTRSRLAFTPDEQPMIAQIWGNDPDQFREMATGLRAEGFAGIDINMGCPAKDVVKIDAGSGLIKKPELAAELIARAKEGELPVSVKTRLGYSSPDEWHDWLIHILKQDIVNLTIHLRTRKEMSKVPAHFELIPEIKKLRDQIAPQTLLTINGDIRDRQHGIELVEKYGVDGIMIGRGIFQNPFAFENTPMRPLPSLELSSPVPRRSLSAGPVARSAPPRATRATQISSRSPITIQEHLQPEFQATPGPDLEPGAKPFLDSNGRKGEHNEGSNSHDKEALIALLQLHLDLFDKYALDGPRHFDPLKRFFKIYIRDFPGASELREKLMHAKSTNEVRALLK